MRTTLFTVGEAAPWFVAPAACNPQYRFDTVAGRTVVLCFFRSAADAAGRRVLDDFLSNRPVFDEDNVAFFGVSTDPEDEQATRVQDVVPGMRFFWDFDLEVSRQFGAVDGEVYRPHTLVLDPRLRVLRVFPFGDAPETHVARVLEFVAGLPPLAPDAAAAVQAPVLVVPHIFEPELCRELIAYYDAHGGTESGFMREIDGKTVAIMDPGFKRRRDVEIASADLRRQCMIRIHDRLASEIHKAYQFHATRMERYIVSCYDAQTGGYFRPHRDNTTKGTAHRRFACSLNLNTGEYDGGELRFPEFGRLRYAAPAGGAVVFSCSLQHEATPVTRGKRYAFLPFLYDEAALKVRQENFQFLNQGPPIPANRQ